MSGAYFFDSNCGDQPYNTKTLPTKTYTTISLNVAIGTKVSLMTHVFSVLMVVSLLLGDKAAVPELRLYRQAQGHGRGNSVNE